MCGVYQPLSLSKPYVEEIPPTKPDQDKFKATAVQEGGGGGGGGGTRHGICLCIIFIVQEMRGQTVRPNPDCGF